jgi:hypothetical protein
MSKNTFFVTFAGGARQRWQRTCWAVGGGVSALTDTLREANLRCAGTIVPCESAQGAVVSATVRRERHDAVYLKRQ